MNLLAIACGAVFCLLAVSLGIRFRRREGDSWLRAITLIVSHAAIGVCVIAPGFVIEPMVWSLFNDGVMGMWTFLGSDAVGIGAIFQGSLFAVAPGIAAGTAAVLSGRVRSRIMLASVAAIALLAIQDCVSFSIGYLPSLTREQLLFSLLSDLVGGGLGGFIIAWISTVAVRPSWSDGPMLRSPLVRQGVALCVVLLVLPAGIAVIYFAFFYHLPVPVIVNLQEWKRIKFDYLSPAVGRRWALPVTTAGVASGPFQSEATLRWDQGDTSISLGVMLPKWEETLLRSGGNVSIASLARLSRPVSSRSLTEGTKITIQGRDFMLSTRLETGVKPVPAMLLMQNLSTLELSRDSRDTLKILSPGSDAASASRSIFAPRLFPTLGKQLVLSGVAGAELYLDKVDRLAILVNRPSGLRSKSVGEDRFRVRFSDGTELELAGDVPKTEAFAALIVIGQKGRISGQIVVPFAESALCWDCEVGLRAFRLFTPTIGQLQVDGAKGVIEVGLNAHTMNEGSELYLGGRRLVVSEEDKSALRITGKAAPVVLNSVVLSQTVWSAAPNEVKAAVIIALGGLAFAPLRRALNSWRGGSS